MPGFGALGSLPLGGSPGVVSAVLDIAIETDLALDVTVVNEANSVSIGIAIETDLALGVTAVKINDWPFDDLRPRHIGIHPSAAPIGGGIGLAGREPTIDSGAGFWRIVYGGIPINTRPRIMLWRMLEARFEGRAKTIALPFFDGKRAPWLGTPGGAITATANAAVAKGETSIQILATSAGEILVGQIFSAGDWGYELKTISGPVANVYTCTIWPKTREAIASGASLEFRRPVGRFRLENDNAMKLPLTHHRFAEASVSFVEDVPEDV